MGKISQPRTAGPRPWVIVSSALVLLFVYYYTLNPTPPLFSRHSHHAQSSGQAATCRVCRAPKQNVWADLSEDEGTQIMDYLHAGDNPLNLTWPSKATSWDNHVAFLEVVPPNKTDALKYLEGRSGPPARYARISINNGSTEHAGIHQYIAGPLPLTEKSTIAPLTFCYNSGRNYVRNPLPNVEEIFTWFASLGHEISDLIEDLLPDVSNPADLPNVPPLLAIARPASFSEDGTIESWAQVHGPGMRFDAWSINPEGLYCKFKITGRDKSHWTIEEWYYNNVFYNSTESLRAAWKEPGFQKLPPNHDGAWSAAEPNSNGLTARAEEAPISIQPGGGRFAVDEKEKFVSWMGFEFYLTTMQATGLSLWDTRFRGDPVFYEVTLQEALAHYAGADPMQAGMLWMDALFGMGFNMYELVPGYDCPAYATYLSTSFQMQGKTVQRNNSICIFEYTSDHLLQRHTTTRQVTASKNTYLVVRSVSTVGNYDYTIDYLFYLDGTVEVKVRASGYIFGAYNQLSRASALHKRGESTTEALQYDYGYQIRENLASSMHDHGLSFKADMDIAGTRNTMYKLNISPYQHRYPWDPKGRPSNTMHLTLDTLKTEQGINWPANAKAMFLVLNDNKTNAWGEKRGYRITPGTGMGTPPRLTIANSTVMVNAARWAENDLFVLRQHDEEHRGASEYNAMEPLDPLVDFSKMVDGEGIVDEDLVIYFTLGTHHVAHSGDIPNTLMHTSASSVVFTPHNFHDRDASRDSAQGVRLDLNGPGEGANVTHFGAQYGAVKMSRKELEPDLRSYSAPDQGMMVMAWNETLAAL